MTDSKTAKSNEFLFQNTAKYKEPIGFSQMKK